MTSTEVLNFSTHAWNCCFGGEMYGSPTELFCESISYQFIYFARPISTVVNNTITLMILVKSQRLYKQHAVASIYLI